MLFPGTWGQCHCNRSIDTTRRPLQRYHGQALKIKGSPRSGTISYRSHPRSGMGNLSSHHSLPHGPEDHPLHKGRRTNVLTQTPAEKKRRNWEKETRIAETPCSKIILQRHAYAKVIATWKCVLWLSGQPWFLVLRDAQHASWRYYKLCKQELSCLSSGCFFCCGLLYHFFLSSLCSSTFSLLALINNMINNREDGEKRKE